MFIFSKSDDKGESHDTCESRDPYVNDKYVIELDIEDKHLEKITVKTFK